ncbi:MAG: hypothetical protein ABSH44_04995 [Bryobacteraceae bacterium]|jgi:hypothetical protein
MSRKEERIRDEVRAGVAALESEVRERGARAGLNDVAAADPGPVVRARLQALAEAQFGVSLAGPAVLAEQIQEFRSRCGDLDGRVAAYRGRSNGDPAPAWSALPGWRRAVTVFAGAGFAGLALVALGAPPTWLLAGMLACLAAAAFVNAAGFERTARAALRTGGLWWDYRRDCWTASRLRRRISRLETLRWKELGRQNRVSQWVDRHETALEAEFRDALELGRKARGMGNLKTA